MNLQEADPKYLYSYLNIANVYVAVGNFIEAKKYLNEGMSQNMDFTPLHRLLSRITKYTNKDSHLMQLKKLYKKFESNNDEDKMNLAFALGKANEDIENFDESFSYYQIANSINRLKINFSKDNEKNYFDEIKHTYNKNIFNKYKNYGIKNSSPIFIVGMPRSGTTLVEQILSSHTKVFGGDEVVFLPNLIHEYFGANKINLFLQDVYDFDKNYLTKIANKYIALMKSISN